MGYRKALLFRWSRRDQLTVIVVAVTAAFLIGTALLLFTAVTYSETFAEPLSNSATVSYETADGDPPPGGDDVIVLPLAQATTGSDPVHVVGIPPDAPREIQNGSAGWQRGRLPRLPDDADARGPVSGKESIMFRGSETNTSLTVISQEAGNTFFDSDWYVTNATVAEELGVTGYLRIDQSVEDGGGLSSVPEVGIPLVSALLYVLGGLEQVLWALGIAVVAGGLLILIVIYSVTKMSVRDRTDAIQVIRSTGGTGWQVGLLFTARATLLVCIGVAVGYAGGLIAIKALVNVAVFIGLPISLGISVTGQSIPVVVGVASLLVGIGIIAGALAAYPAATRSPATLGNRTSKPQSTARDDSGILTTLRGALSPTLLSWQSLVPTAATLTVFALTFLLVVSIAGLASPLSGDAGGTGTITEADAAHPLNSRLDADYARALRAGGTPASPEIIYAQVRDGQPYLAHGAEYRAFANVTGASLVEGERPAANNEAVIGVDLAQTLDVSVGDTITLGGSVSPGVRQVEVVGTYHASGTLDDLLIVPLESVWGLATPEGTVHTIRVAGDIPVANSTATSNTTQQANRSGLTVTGLSGPETVIRGDNFTTDVKLRNFGSTEESRTVTIRYENQSQSRTVSVPAGGETTVGVDFQATTSGNHTARAGDYTHTVRVVKRNAIRIPSELPSEVPPGAGLYVPVLTNDEKGVAGATVDINGVSSKTREEGVAVLPMPTEPGNYTITAQKGNRTARHEVRVVPGTERELVGTLEITPQSGNVLTNPTLTVELGNPWLQPITREVTVDGPGTSRERLVTLSPGNVTRTEFSAGRETETPPGTYTFTLAANGTALATTEYAVTGDDRLASAVASSGTYATGTTLERSIEGVFGNVQLILVVLIVLAAVSTVGSTTATFAQAVHARRETIGIYRSTGATRGRLLKIILADVARISIPATGIALGLAVAGIEILDRTDQLVFFGFRLSTTTPPVILLVLGIVGVVLAILGAVVAVYPYLVTSPVSLLSSGARIETQDKSAQAQRREDRD